MLQMEMRLKKNEGSAFIVMVPDDSMKAERSEIPRLCLPLCYYPTEM